MNPSEQMKANWKNPEFRKKMSEKIPWNKGLTVLTDSKVKNSIEKRKATMDLKYGPNWISDKVKEKNRNPSAETCKRRSASAKKRWLREHDKIVASQNVGKAQSEKFKLTQSKKGQEVTKKLWSNPEYKLKWKTEIQAKMIKGWKESEKWLESVTSEEYRNVKSLESKQRWADPEYKDRVVKAVRKGCFNRPTQPEKKLVELLAVLLPGEYRYVGNGDFILGGLNPDFVNISGQKKIIEVFGRVFHDPLLAKRKLTFVQTEYGRKLIFARYGYETLIVWDDDFSDLSKLSRKIQSFNVSKKLEVT